ncbi:MAG: diguanylate cyclase [Clostridiales bacterium]|nr:diguanylate cyclase [Clostridiales bacterium]
MVREQIQKLTLLINTVILVLTKDGSDLIETLRKAIEETKIDFEKQKISVTVTAGVAKKDTSLTVDRWIDNADEKLYFGKNNGKNRVVN